MKRQRQIIGLVAAVVLLGRWLDVYLMIFPGIVGESPTLGLWEIGLTLGGVGALAPDPRSRAEGSAGTVPLADPELVESLENATKVQGSRFTVHGSGSGVLQPNSQNQNPPNQEP